MSKPLYMITECWRCSHVWAATGSEHENCPQCGERNFTGWSQDAEDIASAGDTGPGATRHPEGCAFCPAELLGLERDANGDPLCQTCPHLRTTALLSKRKD